MNLAGQVGFDLPNYATPILGQLHENFWPGFLGAILYGILGILLAIGGFKAFDLINTKIDIQRELAEKQNLAVAIVCAAVILGVSFIVAYVIV